VQVQVVMVYVLLNADCDELLELKHSHDLLAIS
jgi:hypothetical protein